MIDVTPFRVLHNPKAAELESRGWREWLLTLFPFAFDEDFSADHCRYWELRWSVFMRIRQQREYDKIGLPYPPHIKIDDDEWVTLLLLGRGIGKSSTIEAGGVMRGALLDGGYCLYVCEAQDQAEEHVSNMKILISHDESRLAEFYPHMVLDENAVISGLKLKDRSDLFMTKNGWICRAKGLNSKLRGLRIGQRRPDDIKIDDIDGVNDSIAVSAKKLKQLTSSVIPTQARKYSTIDFGQNLIAETSVANQIYTSKTDALAARTVIGVTNTFKAFEEGAHYTSSLDESGRIRYKILPTAEPTWDGVDIAQAQKFLNDSGLDTFLSEYMNRFDHRQQERVFHEYDEARQVIEWQDFQRVFGVQHIPQHWKAKAAFDAGYSEHSLSAWGFYATAAQNSPLPGAHFCYRTLTFCKDSIDDQAEVIWERMFPNPATGRRHFEASQSFTRFPELCRLLKTKPRCREWIADLSPDTVLDHYIAPPKANASDEDKSLFYVKQAQRTFQSQITTWVLSHEKTGEQKTLAQKYGIPMQKVRSYGADAGVTEANHLLRGDYTKPHPFYPDEIDPATGLYRLGRPYLYVIVANGQKHRSVDDAGHHTFRQHIQNQRWVEERIGEAGLTKRVPFKMESDHCFIAGTSIATSKGAVAIENVKVGDSILTRKGYYKCRAASITNTRAEIFELRLSDGRSLRGTGNHPVWVEGKGFTPLCLVLDGDRMLICKQSPKQSAKRSTLTEHHSIVTQIPSINIYAIIIGAWYAVAVSHYTFIFGKPLTAEPFLTAIMYTTLTTMCLIMTLQIWSASLIKRIAVTTKRTLRLRLKPNFPQISKKLEKPQKNGIAVLRALNGIVSKQQRHLESFARCRTFATGVTHTLEACEVSVRDFVRTVVSKSFITTSVNSKLVKVVSLRRLDEQQAVYNLSVDQVPEYFANGILVHNCDQFRMFAVDYAVPIATPKTKVEVFEDEMAERGLSAEVIEQVESQADRDRLLQMRVIEERAFTAKQRKNTASRRTGAVNPFRR